MDDSTSRQPVALTWKSKLWRYTSLAKLISMLSAKELYLRRVDLLEDRREAMLSHRALDRQVLDLVSEATRSGVLKDYAKGEMYGRLTAGSSDMLQRASTFVNCWYQSEAESVAMWKVYSGQGIAIQSTLRRLRDSLPDSVNLGQVAYIDYEEEEMNPDTPYLYKDRIYAYENEIRAFVWQPPKEYSILSVSRDQPPGITRPVNLARLIKRVYVAPDSGGWFRDVVQEVLVRYGLETKEVRPSIADSVPNYRRHYEEARLDLIDRAYPLEPYISEDDKNAANVDKYSEMV